MFPFAPKALRRAILRMLDSGRSMNAYEVAGCCFSFRPRCNPGWRMPREAEVVSVRRALRYLIAAGKVRTCGKSRRFPHKRRCFNYELVR
ncbi:hypothetical protein XH96_19885 [Bradyrhizobium sp. CCBAU 51765]|nr:hypothetical protein XH96_19885 [Bradyrhizobium sp. CCBAU 51765]